MALLAETLCPQFWKCRVNRKDKPQTPETEESVLVVGENRNQGEWRKAKAVQHVKERDTVLRGVDLLHKGNRI